MNSQPIKVFIVDDSKLMRQAVRRICEDNCLEVVGEAENGVEALELLETLDPNVIILDVNMPVMDGLTTLKHMMIKKPTPTIMLSTLTREGAAVTFDSFKYGAVDFVTKPSSLDGGDLGEQSMELVRKVRAASEVKLEKMRYIRVKSQGDKPKDQTGNTPGRIVAIGAAEGGYGTLLKLIPELPADLPVAYFIVLHVAKDHIDAFVDYLGQYSSVLIERAVEDKPVQSGTCYLCSGDEYTTIREENSCLFFHVSPAPFATRRGAIDMLMFSVAEHAGHKSIGVILSGSDSDGAEGLCELVATGGKTIVQKPSSCLYRKMPETALERCKAGFIVSDTSIANAISLCCA
ncbi:MAG: chemotaxis protein CheB [Thermodesulfobacteriota bacterium]